MREAIDNGLVPIGKRFFKQDITSIMEAPDLTPGRSWTAKMLGFVPGLFDEAAGTAVKRAIDKAGDFWHNTLLWDRIGDLQMGLYTNLRDDLLARASTGRRPPRRGALRQPLRRRAAAGGHVRRGPQSREHAAVLAHLHDGQPRRAEGHADRLPKDVLAQIERDAGFRAGSAAKPELGRTRLAIRKDMAAQGNGVVALDIALFYVGNSVCRTRST
jgi:hypothetical protein